MIKKKNIIFDLGGVLFEHNLGEAAHHQLFSPIPAGLELLDEVAAQAARQGHHLFVCTNWSTRYMDILEKEHPACIAYFKGIVTPTLAEAKKPDPQIFRYLLETHQLNAADSFFIDDQEQNVKAALALGINAIQLLTHEQVRSELARFGIL
jgi:FMN phosphatase YigB (HAD superfamily)